MATFDELIRANHRTLERTLREGEAPSAGDISGWEYRGFNTPIFTRALGMQKFMKGFFVDELGLLAGYNLQVESPWAGAAAPWIPTKGGGPKARHGFYDVEEVRPGPYGDYSSSVLLNYASGRNAWWDPQSSLRDFLVKVDGDPELMLGKAYVDLLGKGRVFVSFFVLERFRRAPESSGAE